MVDVADAKETVANSTGSNLVKKQIGLTRCQVDDEDLFKNDLGMP